MLWCSPGVSTYVVIRAGWKAASNIVPIDDLLVNAASLAIQGMRRLSDLDAVMSVSDMTYYTSMMTEGMKLTVANANNHQLTYGTFGAAMTLVRQFVESYGGFQSATFDIWDGQNQVGTGTIE